MFLKQIATALLLPPFVLVPIAAAGLLVSRRRSRVGKGLTWSALFLLTLCAMPVVADLLLRSLETDFPSVQPAGNPPAAIIVLGAEIERSTDDGAGAHLGLLSLERLRMGAVLAQRTHLPILVSGGLVQADRPPVADLMAASLAKDFNIPVVWIEDKSSTTWENATLSADILPAKGITSVYVVTHAWHMRRALIAFRHTGLTVTAVPASLPGPLELDLTSFLPNVLIWERSYYAFHEWVGCAWYSLF
jgi:uncharacterized SAM-binding protein YcdF (DUF218 family)